MRPPKQRHSVRFHSARRSGGARGQTAQPDIGIGQGAGAEAVVQRFGRRVRVINVIPARARCAPAIELAAIALDHALHLSCARDRLHRRRHDLPGRRAKCVRVGVSPRLRRRTAADDGEIDARCVRVCARSGDDGRRRHAARSGRKSRRGNGVLRHRRDARFDLGRLRPGKAASQREHRRGGQREGEKTTPDQN